MATEDYVSFETAKLLKEKGFYQDFYNSLIPVWHYNGNKKVLSFTEDDGYPSEIQEWYSAPTLQMTMKWLREKCIFITLSIISFSLNDLPVWNFDIWRNNNHEYRSSDYFDSYEQTCETAIKYCLENLI